MSLPIVCPQYDNSHIGSKMDYAEIAGLDRKRVSRIVFGTLFLHTTDDPCALLDAVIQTGCNAFDCAAIYGGDHVCERLLGNWLSQRSISREDIVLFSKGGCHGQDKLWAADLCIEAVKRDLTASLEAIGTEYLDIYMLHRDDPDVPVSHVVDMMHLLKGEGLFLAWGVSNWGVQRVEAAMAYAKKTCKVAPVCSSPQVSLAQPTRPVWPNTQFMTPDAARFYETSGVAVLGWECLAKGFMAGKWERSDGVYAREMQAKLVADPKLAAGFRPSGATAAQWRELQLTTAFCSEGNFERRDRAEELARRRGLTLAQVALKYVASQRYNSFVLVGTTSAKHFIENVVAGSSDFLSFDEIEYLEHGRPLTKEGSKPARRKLARRIEDPMPLRSSKVSKEQSPEEFVPFF